MNQAIDDFILYLATERGLSANYQISTRYSLETFAAWLPVKKKVKTAQEVTEPMITDYLAERKMNGLANASLRLITIALKIWFRWLHARGFLPVDVAEGILAPKLDRLLPKTLNAAQVEGLLNQMPQTGPLALRDRAMLELLYACGLRAGELTGARLEHLNLEGGWIRATGKGNKTRVIPVGKKALGALEDYLSQR